MVQVREEIFEVQVRKEIFEVQVAITPICHLTKLLEFLIVSVVYLEAFEG